METMVVHEVGQRANGTKIVRVFFFNNDKTNYLVKAQSYFTKHEKKVAKLKYKTENKLN
jgi:hypothetical protein